MKEGKEVYDLSVFTDIKDVKIREAVCDKLILEGIVNGAEYYASINDKNIDLWGIENNEKYYKNLKAFTLLSKKKDQVKKNSYFIKK